MAEHKPGPRIYAELVGCMALWGATWVSGRVVARELTPFCAAFMRFFFASVFLWLMLCRAEGRLPRPPRGQMGGIAFLALSGVFLYNAMFFSGLALIEAGRAAMIVACVPSAVALYAAVALHRRTSAVKAVGIALSLSGVWVILAGGHPLALLSNGVSPGDLFILGCVLAWAAYTIAGGRVMRSITPLAAVTWSCILGCLLLFPVALATGLIGQMAAAGPVIWANLAFLGVAATGLAFTWYYDGILALGARRASVFINLVPVFATAMGAAMLGEGVGMALAVGGAMVLCGVVLANRPEPQPSAEPSARPSPPPGKEHTP